MLTDLQVKQSRARS